jgi:ATP-dependent exoDNAse (exonuclease V) alpha subunit
MVTMRPINDDMTWGDKQRKVYIYDENGEKIYDKQKKTYKCNKEQTTDWNELSKAEEWRAAWADIQNAHLKQHGHKARVDHRSNERRGIEELPTVHMGVAVMQMERRGIRTERGDHNREIGVTNGQIRSLRARINKVNEWLYSVPIDGIAPTMVQMATGVAGGNNLKSRWQKLRDLKAMAAVLIFCQENGISDIADLAATVKRMHEKQYDVANALKKVNRRLETLTLHLAHCENRKQYKSVYEKYTKLSPEKRKAFGEKHKDEIERYLESGKYLAAVLNGRKDAPVKDWRKEALDKTAEQHTLYDEFYKLRGDVKNVEVLRRSAERIMDEAPQERTATRGHDIGL